MQMTFDISTPRGEFTVLNMPLIPRRGDDVEWDGVACEVQSVVWDIDAQSVTVTLKPNPEDYT